MKRIPLVVLAALSSVLALAPISFTAVAQTQTATAAAGIDVNSASLEQLQTLPGVNAKVAADIIKNRPFKDLTDLDARVKGIGKKSAKKLAPLITFGGAASAATTAAPVATTAAAATTAAVATGNSGKAAGKTTAASANKLQAGQTVNINTATLEQLVMVPDVGPKLAQAIIASRPYVDGPDAIKKVKGIGDKNWIKLAPFFTFK